MRVSFFSLASTYCSIPTPPFQTVMQGLEGRVLMDAAMRLGADKLF